MSSNDPVAPAPPLVDDEKVAEEAQLAAVRSRAAVVRALADHMERVPRPAESDGRGEQLREEMALLEPKR